MPKIKKTCQRIRHPQPINRKGTIMKTFVTTNLMKHLNHLHPDEYAQFEDVNKRKIG